MKTRNKYKWVALAVCCATAGAWAATTAEIQALLAQGEKLTIVDVRSEEFYQAGHIPNAINVPYRVLALKNLPPLGRVVVCGRGLGSGKAKHAVRLLNEKPGIQAELLEGGFASWETDRGDTTRKPGFQREQLNYITYQNLTGFDSDDVVLVDLRKPKKANPERMTRQGVKVEAEPISALDKKFPGKTVVKSPFEVSAVSSRTSGAVQRMAEPEPVPVMVLIDSGDGAAEKTARMLRANGIHRVVILAGGERIVERDGAAGLKRMGMGSQTVEGDDE